MNLEQFPESESAKRMLSYLSQDFYMKAYVGKWIFQVMGQEWDSIQKLFEELPEEAFPKTANWTLPYYEQKYGLERLGSVEDRKRALMKKITITLPFNIGKVKQSVNELTGIPMDQIDVLEYPRENRFKVEVYEQEAINTNAKYMLDYLLKVKPAHLILEILRIFRTLFPLDVLIVSKLHVMSDFYPRNNLEVLLMNGSVCFDGSRYFNGYNAEYKIDFYPVIFHARSSSAYIMRSKTDVMIRSSILKLMDFNNEIFIFTSAGTAFLYDSMWNGVADVIVAKEVVHHIIAKSSADEKIEAASLWSASAHAIVKVDGGMRHKEKIGFKHDVRTASFVTVKKDLWYLDGSEQLDGSRLLNAQVQIDEL